MQKPFIEPLLIAEDSKVETPSLKDLTVLPRTKEANGVGGHDHCLHGGQCRVLGTPREERLRPRKEGLPLTVTVEG